MYRSRKNRRNKYKDGKGIEGMEGLEVEEEVKGRKSNMDLCNGRNRRN